MAKLEIPEGLSNSETALAIATQTHECLEEFRKISETAAIVTASQIKSITGQLTDANKDRSDIRRQQAKSDKKIEIVAKQVTSINKTINDNTGKIDNLELGQTVLKEAFGIQGTKPKPIALMSQLELIWKGSLSLGGVIAIWKFADFALPKFVTFVIEMDKWVRH